MEINNFIKKTIFTLILFTAAVDIYSLNEWDIRIEPDLYAVETGLKKNHDHFEFIEASLYFSGVERERISAYLNVYSNIVSSLQKYLGNISNTENKDMEKGELILKYLHENVLKRYEEYETSMDALFDQGLFNCVSSGILYYAVSEACGLKIEGVLTSDHAFCRVIKLDRAVDVETTTVYGYNPGEKKEFADSFGKTGFIYTPPGNYKNREIIGKKDFIALILQNRIAKLQKKSNFTDTVPFSVDRYYILNNNASYIDMLNEFKNFCVVMNNSKEYIDALTFLECVYSEYGYSEKTSDTSATLFQNCIIDKLAADNTADAYDFFYSYARFPLIPSDAKSEMFFEINEKELYLEIQNGDFNKSMAMLEKKRKSSEIPNKVYYEYYVYLYSSEIEKTAHTSGWVSALDLVNNALEKSDDERLLELKKAVIYNIGVIYHNKFADYFNIQDYEKARETVLEGLNIVPDDRKLKNDLKTLEKTAASS